jgi:nitrite reductase/ring-hydroxylating ferredoxin subunit
MDLPASIAALGAQLREGGAISPDPALFNDPNVFAAERERVFARPLMAVDHATRLSQDKHWFRSDAGPRSVVVTRDGEGRLHALRNVCIHAGYPVCEAEEGAAERLVCLYHGWEYALDGRLVEPEFSSRIDPSRLRMKSCPISVRNSLIFVDPSGNAEVAEADFPSLPDWLDVAKVTDRFRHSAPRNWKILREWLRSSPQLFLGNSSGECFDFGPLSFMFAQSGRAVLVRIVPRFTEQTDCHMVYISVDERAESADEIAEQLRNAEPPASWFDRRAADWYWSLMSAA